MYDLLHIRPTPKWKPSPEETRRIIAGLASGRPARPRHLLTDDEFEQRYDPGGWLERRKVGLLQRIADSLEELTQAQLPPPARAPQPRAQQPRQRLDQPRSQGSIEQL